MTVRNWEKVFQGGQGFTPEVVAMLIALEADLASGGGGGGGTVNSVAAGDSTITVGGTSTDPTVAVTASTYQPLDSDLTAIAALTTTAFGRALLALADAAALRTASGLGTAATHPSTDFDVAGAAAAAQAASQPLDSDLTAIAALTTTSYGRGLLALANAAAADFLVKASNLSDLANAGTARTNLGVAIGSNVQAWDADLDAIAALTSAANKVPYSTGAQAWALADLTAFARTFLDDADAATVRATLGVIASLFQSGGAQALALDTLAATTDITTLNASTSAHGLLPKLDNNSAHYIDGTGAWSTPPGTGGSLTNSKNYITSDVTITTAGTFYDGPTLTLAAGTWWLQGTVQLLAGSTALRTFTAKLWDGTTITSKNDFATFGTGGAANILIPLSGIVVPGTSTAYKISCTSTVSAIDVIKGTSPSNTNSYLLALKIG